MYSYGKFYKYLRTNCKIYSVDILDINIFKRMYLQENCFTQDKSVVNFIDLCSNCFAYNYDILDT